MTYLEDRTSEAPPSDQAWSIETNGINPIPDSERHGRPRDQFWIWCAANIGILGITYGTYLVAFGLNWWQSILAGVIGTITSFLLVGLVALAGKRSGAPTMILSRASFGLKGNAFPTVVSYLSLIGWEIVLASLATLATGSVLGRLGVYHGRGALIVAFLIVLGATVAVGLLGHATIVRVQTWFTWAFAVLTAIYFVLVIPKVHFHRVASLPSGNLAHLIGGISIVAAGLGIGWVNSGADYSRYLPRRSSSRSVVGWVLFGSSIAPVLLIAVGVLLGANDPKIAASSNPIGILADPLPTWFLVPYLITAVGGLVAGAVMDIYSSGLNLLTLGVKLPRYKSVLIDGVLMTVGTVYIVFFANNFIAPFEGFLVTLAVPVTAWAAIFLTHMLFERRDGYSNDELYATGLVGQVRAVRWDALLAFLVTTFIGLGLVTSTAWIFHWTGYLLGLVGGKTGTIGTSSIGIIVAFVLGALIYAGLNRTSLGRRPVLAASGR